MGSVPHSGIAFLHGDFQVDGMDNIPEGRDETVEPLKKEQALRVAIVGASYIARVHARAARELGGDVVGVCGRTLASQIQCRKLSGRNGCFRQSSGAARTYPA